MSHLGQPRFAPSMSVFPSQRLVMDSPFSPDELVRRLEERVDRQILFEPRTADRETEKPYEGWIEGDRFLVAPVHRSFKTAPQVVIEGRFEAAGPGTRVHARLRLEATSALMLLPLMVLAGLGSLIFPTSRPWRTPPRPGTWLVGVALLAMGYLLGWLLFWTQEPGMRRFLTEVAGAEPGLARS